jgi:hypothetical protein
VSPCVLQVTKPSLLTAELSPTEASLPKSDHPHSEVKRSNHIRQDSFEQVVNPVTIQIKN